MPTEPSDADRELIATAERVLRERYDPDRHTTAAALRTGSGDAYAGVSLKARTGVADVHAEPVAVARAVLDGETELDTVVAVQPAEPTRASRADVGSEIRIVSACGRCRELLLAFGPDMEMLLDGADGPRKRRVAELPAGE